MEASQIPKIICTKCGGRPTKLVSYPASDLYPDGEKRYVCDECFESIDQHGVQYYKVGITHVESLAEEAEN